MFESQRVKKLVVGVAALVAIGWAPGSQAAEDLIAPPILLPILGPPIARFLPDVSDAPPPSGILPPAPPAFQRQPCQASACSQLTPRSIGIIPSPPPPGTLPGQLPGQTPGLLPGQTP